jgi:hypothetical protein
LLMLRVNRYSWWVHWRELADYVLPRRYKWIITPNQASRGSPINQHIIDSTGTLSARNLSSGMMNGWSSPARPWFRLKIGKIDSTMTGPISLWLAEAERLMMMVFHESNFYTSLAMAYFDLVVFGTASMIIYENYDRVVWCFNPCLGEFYLDNDENFNPRIFYREFVLTVDQVVRQFGIENVSTTVKSLYQQGGKSGQGTGSGSGLAREIIVAHAIEPNDDGRDFGIPSKFKFRECYWEWGGSASPQSSGAHGFLDKRGFNEQPHVAVRWDLVSNDPYGRSPAMDALGDIKQLQQETRRKSQAIDKTVNPPMIADVQLKNQPASLLPGGITYVSGYSSSGNPGFSSVFDTKFPVGEITEDLNEVRDRIKKIFFNDLFQVASQYETRSNVTAVEWDMRKAESLVMIGPIGERVSNELLSPAIERVFAIMARARILPPAPAEIAGASIDIEFVSILAIAQAAASAAGIERTFAVTGNLAGIDPAVVDGLDVDFGLAKYSYLMNNDPRLVRSPAQLAAIRARREQQAQLQQRAELAEKMAAGAKTMSETQVGGGQNALQAMTGIT